MLRYISDHPNESNSMMKSQVIFKTLQMNEISLSGYINILRNGLHFKQEKQESVIIRLLAGRSVPGIKTQWDGKWLYDNNNVLVSQSEISKHDLNQSIYGKPVNDSELYNLLGFCKNEHDLYEESEKEYDLLSSDQKKSYFEIEVQRRFGISVDDLENQLRADSRNKKKASQSDLEEFEFPIHNVNNWRALKKHAAESLYFADSVTYMMVQRSVRVSKNDDGRAYVQNMYRVNSSSKTACQMCHKPVKQIYASQIEDKPDLELDQMYLSLCPNCSGEFRLLRNNKIEISRFLQRISSFTNTEIEKDECVKVPIGSKSIWFTQTHIAEIKELLNLKNQVDDSTAIPESKGKISTVPLSTQRSNSQTARIDKTASSTKYYNSTGSEYTRTIANTTAKKQSSQVQSGHKTQVQKRTNSKPAESIFSKSSSTNPKHELQTPQIKVKRFDNNPGSANVEKSFKCIHEIDQKLTGKMVYLNPEHAYATVTKIDGNIISFSYNDEKGSRRQVHYYIEDCKKYDLVYGF